MKRVFFSYSYHDVRAKKLVSFLCQHLESMEAESITIAEAFGSGDNWQTGITDQINKCSVFVSFLESGSPNMMFELGYAYARNKQIVLVGDYKSMPLDLQSMLYLPRDSSPSDILWHISNSLSSKEGRSISHDPDFSQPNKMIKTLAEQPEILDTLDSNEFEKLIMQWFAMKDFHVDQDLISGDSGYDFIIEPFRGDRALVEVKKYKNSSRVSLGIVKQIIGSMVGKRVPSGIIVSSAPFTGSAIYFAKDVMPTVLLWTLDDLMSMNDLTNRSIEQYETSLRKAP